MRKLISRIVAGVVAGVIVVILTQRYLLTGSTPQFTPADQQQQSLTPTEQMSIQEVPAEAVQEETPGSGENEIPRQEVPSLHDLSPAQAVQPPPEVKEDPPAQTPSASQSSPERKRTVEEELQPIVESARARGDSLSKDPKIKPEVKKLRKKSEDVFEELEKETEPEKDPTP